MGYSIRELIRRGQQINTQNRSFSGGVAISDPWVSQLVIASGTTKYKFFEPPATQNLGNTPKGGSCPKDQTWDLRGLTMFWHTAAGTAMVAADVVARNLFLQNSVYSIQLNKVMIRDTRPLWDICGSMIAQETAVSTTLAMQTASPRIQEWRESWPDELIVPIGENVELTFVVETTAAAATAAAGAFLGFAFDRDVAAIT